MQRRAQRAVAEGSADVGAHGGIMKRRPRPGLCSCPPRPSCRERAWLQNTAISPPSFSFSFWAGRAPLREHLGVKVEKVSSLFLIQSAPCWTLRLLTGNTSKAVHAIAYLFIPASPSRGELAIRHHSHEKPTAPTDPLRDHTARRPSGA